MANISNSEDVIDSRDVIARIDELESERQDLVDEVDSAVQTVADASDDTSALSEEEVEEAREALDKANDALSEWDADNAEELATLTALAEEGGSSPDWPHGETLIRYSYFKESAQQLAEDIGAINPNASWPNDCIDWDEATRQLKFDYSSVDFDGVEYWIRS